MTTFDRFAVLASLLLMLLTLPAVADAQRQAVPRHPPHQQPAVSVRGHVFIGGYYYDPVFGPYPWWPRRAYQYWYFPVYDHRADLRLHVKPDEAKDAAVYVDGFYAGLVDDFDSAFQRLPLTPGGHTVVLYFAGYRTVRQSVYLRPGSGFSLRATMERLPEGETSEPPEIAPPVPAPPPGTYRMPATPPRMPPPHAAPRATRAVGFGTLDLYVQPESADVTIDGERWATSDEGHFLVQVPVGQHRVEIRKPQYRTFMTEIDVAEGQTVPLNVSLMTMQR